MFDKESGERTCATDPGPTVSVDFDVQAATVIGGEKKILPMKGIRRCTSLKCFLTCYLSICSENVLLVGSVPELGNWSPDHAIPLSTVNYPTWNGENSS